jgi:hypothetical protein
MEVVMAWFEVLSWARASEVEEKHETVSEDGGPISDIQTQDLPNTKWPTRSVFPWLQQLVAFKLKMSLSLIN